MQKTITIKGEFIELYQLIKFAGLVENGAAAKETIRMALVQINGELAHELRKKVKPGDTVLVGEVTLKVTAGTQSPEIG